MMRFPRWHNEFEAGGVHHLRCWTSARGFPAVRPAPFLEPNCGPPAEPWIRCCARARSTCVFARSRKRVPIAHTKILLSEKAGPELHRKLLRKSE